MTKMKELTQETFRQFVYDYKEQPRLLPSAPVFIDFYSQFCQPCKMMEPVIDQLSTEYKDIQFYKAETSECSELCSLFNFVSVPTFVLINPNGNVTIISGATPKVKLKEAIEKHLKE
jgi:thioredoxin 1